MAQALSRRPRRTRSSHATAGDLARRLALTILVIGGFTALAPTSAMASQFRYGNLNWQKAGPTGPNGGTPVTFQNEQSWRASAFGTPAVGSIVSNSEGCITFGDGTPAGCPMYRVTFVNPAEDYLIMHALAPRSTTDRNVPHTYATAGPFTATTSRCCTISSLNTSGGAPATQDHASPPTPTVASVGPPPVRPRPPRTIVPASPTPTRPMSTVTPSATRATPQMPRCRRRSLRR